MCRDSDNGLKQLRYTIYDYLQVPAIKGYVLQLSDASDLQVRETEISLLQHILKQKVLYNASTVLVFNDQGEVLQVFAPEIFQTQFPALVQKEASMGGFYSYWESNQGLALSA